MPLTHIGKSRKTFPKSGVWLRGYPGKFFQTFFRFCNFGAWLRGFSGKFFQVNFMSTYPWKNIFFPKTGHDSEAFPENFSRRISDATSQEKVFINTFWWHLGLKSLNTIRYIPLRNNLSWISKPILSVIDYQMLNCFFLHKEIHENPLEYRKYLLLLAQGFCRESLKPRLEPLRVKNHIFARSKCRSCSNISPYKDTRTTQVCRRCGSGCCKTHSRLLCSQCFDS